MSTYLRIEDLQVYQKLCHLHLEVCDLTRAWPSEERFELASQIRRSSNSAPANLAEKHSDRHVRNKIEGVNRARGEALETVHHLYIAMLKQYVTSDKYQTLRDRYLECVRMLNGLERTLERRLDASARRWPDSPSQPPTTPPGPEP
jgi:four helix bundle protein